MNLNANQIAFILDAIDMFEDFGDYTSEDGTYSLTEKEIDEFIEMLQTELKELK